MTSFGLTKDEQTATYEEGKTNIQTSRHMFRWKMAVEMLIVSVDLQQQQQAVSHRH